MGAAALIALGAVSCADQGPTPEALPAALTVVQPEPIAPLPLGKASRPPSPDPSELTIQFVQRLPAIDYVPNSTQPARDGWPTVGQAVTWRAHVKNWYPRSISVGYRWTLDGTEVAAGRVNVGAGDTAVVDYSLPWAFERRQLAFRIDPANEYDEEDEDNNELTVFSDALSVGFYVERSFYDAFRANQYKLVGAHSTSFEDWANRQIYFYNELLRRAVYPETPNGVKDRLRLDRITIVSDGSIVHPAVPNTSDRSVDLQWGFPASSAGNIAYRLTTIDMDNQAYYSGFVQHELGHARGMIDVYGFDVYDGLPGHTVNVRVNDQRLFGSDWMRSESVIFNGFPGQWVRVAERGLMSRDWTFLDRYSAAMWNQIAGHRAVAGNYNAPANIGWFMNALLPDETRIVVADANRNRLPRARVRIFRGVPSTDAVAVPYGRVFKDAPDVDLVANDAGEVVVGRNPFTAGTTTSVVHNGEYSNAVVLVEVERNGRRGFTFLPVSELNYAVIAGQRRVATIVVQVDLR